jgi:hypothetical protein
MDIVMGAVACTDSIYAHQFGQAAPSRRSRTFRSCAEAV